ncbi:FUSC family protein [Methylobacterium sp. E-066]|uniref:FUSC family protein n=1 Tax=Methylobacterium sp. E-066 TaxID=2836584 RepID=UPI001FB9E65F|nr:FUSC family protein [Methylobacterium sp. E-066]MCJ2140231.1 FUSC family protein [Methylobacterium sp. E-066]
MTGRAAHPSSRAVVFLRSACERLLAIDILTPRGGHVARSTGAAILALGVAFGLQLETPYSAASTVLLVANANQGAVLAKGGWRLVGTVIGGVAALALMGLFIQAPVLFILGFALWLGLCTAGATLLRHFRASGAAVAGYTVGLATYGALETPERALDAVLGRTATVAVGVVCLGVVAALFSKRATRSALDTALIGQCGTIAGLALERLRSEERAHGLPTAPQIAGLFAIDDLLELSRAESPDLAGREGAVRDTIAALFGALLGTPDLCAVDPQAPRDCVAAHRDVVAGLPRILALIEARRFADALDRITALRETLLPRVGCAETAETGTPAPLIALDRLVAFVEDYGSALSGMVRLHGGRPIPARSFRFHRDWGAATENGLRSALAILLAGAFGIATGWNDWSLLLLILAPYSVLLAMTGNPAAGAVAFIQGTIVAVPAAFVCAFGLMPSVQGFPLLIAVIAPFWMAGLYATTVPRHAPAGLAYLVAFNTLVGATNPMVFSVPAFLNQAFGWVAAVFVTLLVFRLLLPHDPRRQAHRIQAALRRDALARLEADPPEPRHVWEHLQHHRLARIALSLRADPAAAAMMTADGIAALQVGRAAIRARAAARNPTAPALLRTMTLRALSDATRSPRQARDILAAAAAEIAARSIEDPRAWPVAHRVAACLTDMAMRLEAHPDRSFGRHRRVPC